MIGIKNIQMMLRDLVNNSVFLTVGAGVPTDGTSGTGLNLAGKATLYFDKTNGEVYINKGTAASPLWKKITTAA